MNIIQDDTDALIRKENCTTLSSLEQELMSEQNSLEKNNKDEFKLYQVSMYN